MFEKVDLLNGEKPNSIGEALSVGISESFLNFGYNLDQTTKAIGDIFIGNPTRSIGQGFVNIFGKGIGNSISEIGMGFNNSFFTGPIILIGVGAIILIVLKI